MSKALPVVLSLAAAAAAGTERACAKDKATFLGPHTYATAEGCKKLEAIAKGGPKNVETVPETLTQTGFKTWEGGCKFVSVRQKRKGKTWVARMSCHEGAQETEESTAFEKLADGRIEVTVDGKITFFEQCKTHQEAQ